MYVVIMKQYANTNYKKMQFFLIIPTMLIVLITPPLTSTIAITNSSSNASEEIDKYFKLF